MHALKSIPLKHSKLPQLAEGDAKHGDQVAGFRLGLVVALMVQIDAAIERARAFAAAEEPDDDTDERLWLFGTTHELAELDAPRTANSPRTAKRADGDDAN